MTASRILKPRPCSASQACTPPAASSPSAEPPDSAMASISWTVLSGLRRPSSRVPGPPPRTSIEATAGESKMTAVTPEASAASSAWPTRTPDMSVMRFFNAAVRQAAFGWPFLHGYISREDCSTGKRQPDHPGKLGFAIGFGQQQHAGIQPAVVDNGVLGIARCVERLEARPPLQGFVDELAAIHDAGHDHVGEKQVDGGDLVDEAQRVGRVGRLQCAVAQALDLGHHIAPHQRIVLDDEDRFVAALDSRRDQCFRRGLLQSRRPRQVDLDGGAMALLAVDLDVSARLLDEAEHHAEAKAGTSADLLGGKKGFE